uniref:RNI-like superfamily protein n=1 Tax=Tanacetum cinerariifolium TaxID=118510 RepID=A0A699J418_TANCI|nr:RNI-like superfamily protein [Tanacetum cinerariifolium]
MDKGKRLELVQNSYKINDSIHNSKNRNKNYYNHSLQSSWSPLEKRKPPALVSLCLGIIGKHLEDVIDDLEVLTTFPPDIKMVIAAIARRRKLLNDDVIEMCRNVRAVDISRCSKITSFGVSELVKHYHCLKILRWGGCPRSEHTARSSISILKPTLNDIDGDSWEELDATEIVHGAQSLRIDILRHALPSIALGDFIVEEIDPNTWVVPEFRLKTTSPSLNSIELPITERFRLAFVERDARLAPKRAKNARQRQRRAERE